MRKKFHKPPMLRYTVVLELSDKTYAGIGFDAAHEALSFAKKITMPGDWWEIIDNHTGNVPFSAKDS